MAKNGQNDLIFGKLVISNDFKRLMEDFLKILICGRFFAFFGPKSPFLTRKSEKIGQKSKFSKNPPLIS